MPRLQDIERFKRDLAALSHEKEILEFWGEKAEDVEPPPTSAPLAGAPEAAPTARYTAPDRPALGREEEPSEGIPPDFASLLENMPLGPTEEEGAAEAGPLEELLGAPEAIEAETGAAEAPSAEASAKAGEDFSMPEFDLGDFAAAEANIESAEEPTPAGPAGGEDEAAQAEDFSLPDLDLGETGAPESGTRAPAAGEDEFGIPDMSFGETPPSGGDLSLGPLEAETPAAEAPAAAGGAADAFESFNFEESGAAESGFGSASFEGDFLGTAPERDLDREIASLSDEAPAADTFTIDNEWGGGFAEVETPGAAPRGAPPRPEAARPARPAPEEKVRPVALNEAQVDRLQDSLLSYPLNLRVAVEDILANEKGGESQRSRLVWLLAEGAAAEEAAILAGRVLKRRIEIPRGYEKRTGAALEAEKGKLAYAFVHTFLPALRIGLLVVAATGLLAWLVWRFVYTPLAANALYRSGYQLIVEDRYPEADATFDKATRMREFVVWYYRYAAAYAAKRQYFLAEKKYQSLLDRYPRETAGALAWARLERDQLKYQTAVDVLKKRVLNWDYFNKAALLLLGDVYLDWADEDPKWYEEARRSYAGLIQHYGAEDAYLERMLLYFIRTDNLKEVMPLKERFLGERKTSLGVRTLAELGGYLLDKGKLEDVHTILTTAALRDPALPEAHYQLVRYFRLSGSPDEERKALDNAVKTFEALPGLTGKRAGMYIDSLIWRGRYRVQAKEWIGAEADFATAAAEYEKDLELRRVQKSGRFGEAYAGLAEVAYWQRNDLDLALGLLERAADNGYDTADARYKRGYILYAKDRLPESLEQFYWADRDSGGEGGRGESPYLLFAFGNALYARQDYSAAEGYFRRCAEAMDRELQQIDLPDPREKPSEAEIIELLMKSENNLGAALLRVASRVGNAGIRDEATAVFARATRLFDSMGLIQSAPGPTEMRDLASHNLDLLIHPRRGAAPELYTELEREIQFPKKG